MQFDYIVIANYNDLSIEQIVSGLIGYGIPREKIVVPYILRPYSREKYQEDLCRKIRFSDEKLYGLVMGMSYSLMGVNTRLLKKNYLNISWHSMDFYYNIRLFEYGIKNGKFKSLKKILFVMPYYYFNYEESQSYHAFNVGEMFSLRELRDWHNVNLIKEEFRKKANNLILNYEMFGKKLSEYYHVEYAIYDTTVYSGDNESEHLNNVWWKIYNDTISENIEIFTDFVKEVTSRNIDLEIVVPPYYIPSLDKESKERVRVIRDLFFECLNKVTHETGVNIKVNDYFTRFSDKKEFFKDFRHLNVFGAESFTKMINEQGGI